MSWDVLRPSGRKRMTAPLAVAVMLAGLMAATAMAAVPDNTAAPTITGGARRATARR